MRLILTLEYDGTPFYGWAAQPGLPTIEAALREGSPVALFLEFPGLFRGSFGRSLGGSGRASKAGSSWSHPRA